MIITNVQMNKNAGKSPNAFIKYSYSPLYKNQLNFNYKFNYNFLKIPPAFMNQELISLRKM